MKLDTAKRPTKCLLDDSPIMSASDSEATVADRSSMDSKASIDSDAVSGAGEIDGGAGEVDGGAVCGCGAGKVKSECIGRRDEFVSLPRASN